MKKFSNGASILAACAGLLAVPAAWGQGPFFGGVYEVRVDKGETLSDVAWQPKRERVNRSPWTVAIAGADPAVFPRSNVNQQLEGHVLKIPYREDPSIPVPIVQSPR